MIPRSIQITGNSIQNVANGEVHIEARHGFNDTYDGPCEQRCSLPEICGITLQDLYQEFSPGVASHIQCSDVCLGSETRHFEGQIHNHIEWIFCIVRAHTQ